MAITRANGKEAISLRLAKKKISLTIFFDAVGQTVFDNSWPKTNSIKYLRPTTKVAVQDSPEAYVRRVRDDLIGALSAGTIAVGFTEEIRLKRVKKLDASPKIEPKLLDEMFDWASPPLEPELLDEPDDQANQPLQPDYQDHELENPITYNFLLNPSFWDASAQETELWENSEARVKHQFLTWSTVAKGKRSDPFKRNPLSEMPDPFPHKLYIIDPLTAWQTLFEGINVPDEQWFTRYRLYRSVMLQELVTAGWRYLAIRKPSDRHGIISEISQAMTRYLDDQQGIDPADRQLGGKSSLDNIASNLHRQWVNGDVTSPVLINSARQTNPNEAKKQT